MKEIEIVFIALIILITFDAIVMIALYKLFIRKPTVKTEIIRELHNENVWITWGADDEQDAKLIEAICKNAELYERIYSHAVEDYHFMERVASNLRNLQVGR